jgi:predicted CoA-binding protein
VSTNQLIHEFLEGKSFAMVGVSRNPKDFSRMLFRTLVERGHDVSPVNPAAKEIEGRPCYARIQDVPDVKAALLMTPPNLTEAVVEDCADAGVEVVWMYRAIGSGAVSQTALDFCESHGIKVIAGHCPFMFLPNPGFPHNFHGFLLKLTGHYPA